MSMAVLRTVENDLKSAECQSADIVDLREGADRFVFRGILATFRRSQSQNTNMHRLPFICPRTSLVLEYLI